MNSSEYFENLKKDCRLIQIEIAQLRRDIKLEEWSIITLPDELSFLYNLKIQHLRDLKRYLHFSKLELKEESRWLA